MKDRNSWKPQCYGDATVPGLYFQEIHKVLLVKKDGSVRDQERIYTVSKCTIFLNLLSRIKDYHSLI